VKALLPYGKFGEWLKTGVDWTQRTAQNFNRLLRCSKAKNFCFFAPRNRPISPLSFSLGFDTGFDTLRYSTQVATQPTPSTLLSARENETYLIPSTLVALIICYVVRIPEKYHYQEFKKQRKSKTATDFL